MSATPWTPGPWSWSPNSYWGGYSGIVGPDNQEVLYPNTANDGDTGAAWFEDYPSEADARLIQHAPDMAEALAQTAAAMDALHPSAAGDMSDGDYARLWNSTREALDTLLARIRGDAP